MLLQKCSCKIASEILQDIFEEIHGEDPDKYFRMRFSDNLKIITVNKVRIAKSLMENWWIYKTANKRSR